MAQRRKLKQLHWDAVRQADGTVWRDLASSTELDLEELERLFKLLDNKGLTCAALDVNISMETSIPASSILSCWEATRVLDI
jgi:hypothetical protein